MNKADFQLNMRALVAADGPRPKDYEGLTVFIRKLHESVDAGDISRSEIREVLDLFGDVFSEKTLQGCALRKPHGYAGDFEMMDKIYARHVSPDPRLANWDRYFHAQHAPQAVRNRKDYFHGVLDRHARRKPMAVLKLGVGPGRGIFEWLERNEDAGARIECVDVDINAIEHAAKLNARHSRSIRYHHRNVFKFSPAPEQKYDLIWAAGLFDYFDDATFVAIGSRFLKHLAHGGEFIIGNFSTANPSRSYMELFGDWNLHHRSPAQLNELAERIGAPPLGVRVGKEPEGVNLFLHMAA